MGFSFDPEFFATVTREEFIRLHPDLKNAGEIYDQNTTAKEVVKKGK